MKKNSSLKSGIANRRNLASITLCLSGVLLAAVVAVGASGGQHSARTLQSKKQPTIQTTTASTETIVTSGLTKSTDSSSVSKSSAPVVPNAPTPPNGTLSPANPTITYTDGPLIPNTTGLLGPPICSAPGLCSDFVLTVNAASVAATQQIFIEGTWTPEQNDFYYFFENTGGQVIAANESTADPSALILPSPADGTVYHMGR